MPKYISDDWYNYNKKEVKVEYIDHLIKVIQGAPCVSSNPQVIMEMEYEKNKEISLLIAIRRDIILHRVSQEDSPF